MTQPLPSRFALCILFYACCSFLIPASRAADNWIEVKSTHFTIATNAGSKDARKILDQFELFRATFLTAFPSLRVDPAQPMIILAAKNENAMKELLPEEYATKGHIRHAGMFQRGVDKNYVILRLDAEGDNPYHTLYHEYTHSMVSLNFTNVPLWLDEGIAEYLGNAQVGEKEVRIGLIDRSHLYILQLNKLLPIETLLSVGHDSPYYNEENRASVFYAESWAVVHYLMLDPDARKRQLLSKFLQAWAQSGDQIAAATEAFGDLKKFGRVIDGYARQTSFYNGIIKPPSDAAEKNYSERPLSQAEVLALRGDFFAHSNRVEAAVPVLAQAAQLDPKLPFVHEAQGFCEFRLGNLESANHEMTEAIRLGATTFIPYYFHGYFSLRTADGSESSLKEAQEALSKAVQMNPNFAPAYDALASSYERSQDGQDKALQASLHAAKLEPATLGYSVHLTYLLLSNHREADAQVLADRVQKAARTPAEKTMAAQLQNMVSRRAEWAKSSESSDETDNVTVRSAQTSSAAAATSNAQQPSSPAGPPQLKQRYAVDGPIDEADCSPNGDTIITLGLPSGPVSFHSADRSKLEISTDSRVTPAELNNCALWKGLQAKIWFNATPGKNVAGEILKVYLF